MAGHNTVIANASGKSGTSWGTTMSKVNLIACEPKVYQAPISENFSFSTQYLDDTYNSSLQQRTNSIIRTSSTTAYFYDIFRSKGKTTNNYHDYIYHNIGDALTLKFDDATNVPLTASTKYSTDLSGSVTGWKYFESVKSSTDTIKAVEATFTLNTGSRKMNVLMPSGINREYATALAPYTKGVINGYSSKKTPVITIRQQGEAWDKAFVAVFEPTQSTAKTIKSVTNLYTGTKVVGAVVVSVVAGDTITDYILSHENNTSTFNDSQTGLSFVGRFAIVRTKSGANINELTMYIGDGNKLVFGGEELVTDASKKALKTVALNTALRNVTDNNTMLSVFPNPASGMFNIKMHKDDIKLITIVDVSGRTIFENNSGAQQISIDSNNIGLHAGLYFVKVMDKQNRTYVKKLTIHK